LIEQKEEKERKKKNQAAIPSFCSSQYRLPLRPDKCKWLLLFPLVVVVGVVLVKVMFSLLLLLLPPPPPPDLRCMFDLTVDMDVVLVVAFSLALSLLLLLLWSFSFSLVLASCSAGVLLELLLLLLLVLWVLALLDRPELDAPGSSLGWGGEGARVVGDGARLALSSAAACFSASLSEKDLSWAGLVFGVGDGSGAAAVVAVASAVGSCVAEAEGAGSEMDASTLIWFGAGVVASTSTASVTGAC
jgi:hypothetical protein